MSTPPLILSTDPIVVDELSRLAAAAGVAPEVRDTARPSVADWTAAPLVLVGHDLAAAVADWSPPRRDGVHVVARDDVPDELFRLAVGIGAADVVSLPRSRAWLVELLTDAGESRREPGLVVGVLGGSGGAGATTFACALGQVAADTGPTLVVDADAVGPGVDRVLGRDRLEGVGWEALHRTTGRLSARSLREAVPHRGDLGVLTWATAHTSALQPFAVREALSAASRGHDTVVVDLPRADGPLVREVAARCDRLLVVAVATIAGISSTARLCQRLGTVPGALVLRGAGVDRGDVARLTRLPVLQQMRDQRGLDESIDLGLGPLRSRRGVLARTAAEALTSLRPHAVVA